MAVICKHKLYEGTSHHKQFKYGHKINSYEIQTSFLFHMHGLECIIREF